MAGEPTKQFSTIIILGLPAQSQSTACTLRQVYSPWDLVPGNAVLVHLDPEESDGRQEVAWNRCWSLGQVMKIHPSRKFMDVVWLKPQTRGKSKVYTTRCT